DVQTEPTTLQPPGWVGRAGTGGMEAASHATTMLSLRVRAWLMATIILASAAAPLRSAAALDFIRVAPDGRSFEHESDHSPFVPVGVNYVTRIFPVGFLLLEDWWATRWDVLEQDFAAMSAMGFNVVRIHLQFDRFRRAPDRANRASLR